MKALSAVKIVKRLALALLVLLLLVAVTMFIVIRFYEDEVAAFAMKRVQKEMATSFTVGDIGLVFWRTFPSTSLHLEKVYIEESLPSKDTLLYAQSLYLKLNFWDLVKGDYSVNEVEVDNAVLHLKVNEEGADNWHFWKEQEADSSSFSITLEEVQLTDTRVTYDDKAAEFFADLYSSASTGQGDFSASRFEVALDADITISRIRSEGNNYLEDQLLLGEITMQADVEQDRYVFEPAELTCGKLDLTVQGVVDLSPQGAIELFAETTDEEISEALGLLPTEIRRTLQKLNPQGDFSAKTKITQKNAQAPVMLEAEIQTADATLQLKEDGVALNDIQSNLYLVRGGKKDLIKLKQFACALDESELTAKGSIIGFDDPQLDLEVTAAMDMRDIKDFLDLKQLDICEGRVNAGAGVKGKLRYIPADTSFNWREIIASGNAELTGGRLKLKDSNRLFDQLNASVAFDKQSAVINRFEGVVNGGDFRLTGQLINLVPFLFEKDARVLLDGDLKSNVIDFTNLVEEDGSTANDSEYEFGLPRRLDFRMKTAIEKFVFRKFEAQRVRGIATLENGKLTVDPLTFNTADGSLSAQLVMAPAEGGNYRMNCLADITNINIKKVFTEFENFGQNYLQDRHLEGRANAKVQFRTIVTKALEIPSDKIESLIDLSIDNGELIDFESLQDIAEYIRSNKWVAPFVDENKFAEKMRKVTFSRLENVIEIRNRMVTIPLMDIRSSAMDISAKGSHSFDQEINYAIGFNMRDLLIRRERDIQETDDGLGKSMFIAMTGTVDNPVFTMDKELAKEVRQEAMRQEKQNMKSLLKEEFGLFRKDESVGPYKEAEAPKTESTISVEWEETESPAKAPVQSTPAPTKNDAPKKEAEAPDAKKKKTPKWLEEKDQ
jgi:uncharacterized protein involved in outer membrane biogenesis